MFTFFSIKNGPECGISNGLAECLLPIYRQRQAIRDDEEQKTGKRRTGG